MADDAPAPVAMTPAEVTKMTRRIAAAVVGALAEQHAVGRSAYSVAEVAQRAGVSEQFVRNEIHAGRLRAVRPGGREVARVLPEDEALWLQGRKTPADPPAEGISPAKARRNMVRAVVAGVVRQGRRREGR